ncbi:CoA ester lyase [Gordonia terrae]|uniref:HpcH/HpaI aldolase/citrate lyase family protein n=1 Tax=Gordonia terrae TaxID=2055 RepID=UPI00200A08E6|nr:CoA ester lyase [Gordonia terrae]UPW08071.1 CoA ester lyase [Gordonia terrae]
MEQRAALRNNSLAGADVTAPLFVPADRPDRISKAFDRGARAVVIDLEDAVPTSHKTAARQAMSDFLDSLDRPWTIAVRINSVDDTRLQDHDLEAVGTAADRIAAVVIPKVTHRDQVRRVRRRLDASGSRAALIPTVETAAGIRNCWEIAEAESVHTLLFGPVDLTAELGIAPTVVGTELAMARSAVVLACAAARRAAPLDGPWTVLGDDDALRISTATSRNLGFGGKIVIHPDQLAIVHEGFEPSADEVAWATEVVTTYDRATAGGTGAVRMPDGTFIDVPVAARARSILRRSGTRDAT